MDDDETLKLRAKIIDEYSGPLREMQKAAKNFLDMMRETNLAGGKVAKEHGELQKELGKRTEETGKSLKEVLTPAMTALGLATFGAGEGIAKMIELLKGAGENFFGMQNALARTGLSFDALNVRIKAMELMGINAEQARNALSEMGDALARLRRGEPEEIQHWYRTFNNIDQFIIKLRGAKTQAEAMDDAFDFFKKNPNVPPDQKAKFYSELFHLPPELATILVEQQEKAMETAREFYRKHPPVPMETMEALHESFEKLKLEIEGIGIDLTRAFGGEGASLIDKFGEQIKQEVEDVKALAETMKEFVNWLDETRKRLGIKGGMEEITPLPQIGTMQRPFPNPPEDRLSPAYRFSHGYMPMSFETGSSDAENMLTRAVKAGMLDAFREWWASVQAGNVAGGMTPAAYYPGGGGGLMGGSGAGRGTVPRGFGGGGYSVLREGGGAGVGSGVPAGSGPSHPMTLGGSRRDVAKIVADEWARAGMSKEGIAGLMQNIQDESSFNPTLRHADQPKFGGEAHFAHGLYQEGGAEWNKYSSWLQQNYPGSDWRDPALQSRFAAWNLKTYYPHTWREMMTGDRFHAAAAYVGEYLQPADQYKFGRMTRYLRGGVAPLESYTGPRDLLSNAAASGVGGAAKVEGGADLRVAFENAPAGMRASMKSWGLFSDGGKIDWGHAMPLSDPGGR